MLLYINYKTEKVKYIYVDSRYKTFDSTSNSEFEFGIQEGIVLPDIATCYIGDISIPHK